MQGKYARHQLRMKICVLLLKFVAFITKKTQGCFYYLLNRFTVQ